MAEVFPFKAVVYDKERVPNLSDCMAPPYDVISEVDQQKLYNKSPYNIVRLILGKVFPYDTAKDNRYTRARDFFNRWLDEGILITTKGKNIYACEQRFNVDGRRRSRLGFIALLKLEELSGGGVMPHEKTLEGPKADRLKLMRATGANPCQVFQLYSDPRKTVNNALRNCIVREADLEVSDEDGVWHRVWFVEDHGVIQLIQTAMKNKALFIADGHHRYETALNYKREMRQKYPHFGGEASFNFAPMMFVNMNDEGIVIFPTHRLVKGRMPVLSEILKRCSEFFDYRELPASTEEERKKLLLELNRRGKHSYVLYVGKKAFLLWLRDEKSAEEHGDPTKSRQWRSLDVSVLHTLILDRVLIIRSDDIEKRLEYTRDSSYAFSSVDEGEVSLSFIMNPTDISGVKAIAQKGEVMPSKSTYFYPKLRSGLVLNKHVL
ncbi:DUF1015 domain-containing protein [candidate division KSB1 bacterium]|nr:DUF1015 domain-containing protein [candidate division KSB1 bacterium]